tara:strand:+ start:621 stop:1649 length:1029 start_codon:yes stop_codon:yes gene_type:complete
MNILLTCANGLFTGDVVNLLNEVDYVNNIFLCDCHEPKYNYPNFSILPRGDDPKYICELIKICHDKNISYIIPRSDFEIQVISKSIEALKKNNIFAICQPSKFVELLSDKGSFFKALNKIGICVEYYIPRSWQSLLSDIDRSGINFNKLIMKPRKSSGSKGVWLVNTNDDTNYKEEIIKDRTFRSSYNSFIKHMEDEKIDPSSYIIQPYFGSNIFDVDSLYLKESNELLQVCRKRVYRDEFSPVNQGCIVKRVDSIYKLIKNLYLSLDLNGYVDIDVAIDETNKPHIIDASARLSGSISASAQCGINFPKLILDYYVKGLYPNQLEVKMEYVIPYEGFKVVN